VSTRPALAGAGPNARFRRGALWAVLHDVIVLSQPCHDLFEKMPMAYMNIKKHGELLQMICM